MSFSYRESVMKKKVSQKTIQKTALEAGKYIKGTTSEGKTCWAVWGPFIGLVAETRQRLRYFY